MSSNPYQSELMDIVLQLVSMHDQEAILQLALQTVRQKLHLDRAGIMLLDPTARQVTAIVGQVPYDNAPQFNAVWKGLEGWVIQQQSPVLVSDVANDVRISQQSMISLTRDGDNPSVAMAPCGQTGVIVAISRFLDKNSLGLLQTIGKAVGTALANLSPSDQPTPPRRLSGADLYWRPVGPFGQSYQQAHLLRWVGNTENGDGTAVAVEGTVGSGKTTLVNWLNGQAQNRYFQVHIVAAQLYSEPYQIWRQILEHIYPALQTLSPTIGEYKQFLRNIRFDWEVRAPILLNIMTPSHISDLASYTIRQRHVASSSLIRDLILEATQKSPWLLIVEDGQWLDEASLDVFKRMGRWLQHQNARLMLCLTTNDASPQYCQLVQMTTLQPEHVYQLQRALIGDTEVDDKLLQVAQGNPLHIRWLLGTLVERPADDPSQSLEQLIQNRIDSSPSDVRMTFCSATAIGPRFDLAALQAVHPKQPDISVLQDHLRQLGIFVNKVNDDTFAFRHHIYQEQAKLSCPASLFRNLHQAYADYLERHASDQSASIAYHYQQAQLPQQARNYLVRAANTAHARHSYQDAFDYVDTALNLPGELGDMEAFALMSEQADLLRKLEDFDNHAVVLGKLTDIAQGMGDAWLHAESGWRWLQHYLDTNQVAEGLATWKLFLDQAEKAYHNVAKAEIIITSALLYQQMGQYEETQKQLDDATKLASQARNLALGARILLTLGHAFQQNSQFDLAQACFEQAMDVYLLNENQVGIANCLTGLGQMYDELGYVENSTRHLSRAKQIWQHLGNIDEVIDLSLQIVAVLLRHDLAQEATKIINELQPTVESAGDATQLGNWWMLYGRIHYAFDNIEQSLQCLHQALKIYPSDALVSRIELYAVLLEVHPQEKGQWLSAIWELDPDLNRQIYSPQVYIAVAKAIDNQQQAQSILSMGTDYVRSQSQKITDDRIREHYLAHPYRRAMLELQLDDLS